MTVVVLVVEKEEEFVGSSYRRRRTFVRRLGVRDRVARCRAGRNGCRSLLPIPRRQAGRLRLGVLEGLRVLLKGGGIGPVRIVWQVCFAAGLCRLGSLPLSVLVLWQLASGRMKL